MPSPTTSVNSINHASLEQAAQWYVQLNDQQVGSLQNFQVLHHGAAVHVVETLAQSAGGDRAFLQAVQHLPTTSMGQRLENTIIFCLV